MLSELFLKMALISPEWVIWLLTILSILSIAVIVERFRFYQKASQDQQNFVKTVESAAREGDWSKALQSANARYQATRAVDAPDFESGICQELIQHRLNNGKQLAPEVFAEIAHEVSKETLTQTRLRWEKGLALLATIGSNAPFLGLFGTVLGIIQAFDDLSTQAQTGVASTITAGLAEALVATAVGILVAIPSVVAFNLYQRKVKARIAEAEAFKSFLIGRLADLGNTTARSGQKG